ncbi:MAG TPA: N-acetylmuramoyl-L-alanine amidase [Solirubrobacteraceae bacterium]|nr:N-acetylmuramoyl-L-alanine amidase [Solirubrobacteraceae bacterium]
MPALTRRQAIALGAATAAFGALRPGRVAAAARAESFSLDLPSPAGARSAGAGWHETRVFRAPRRFDLIGLGWTRGSRVQAQVRARERGGRWTSWTTLHDAGDHGPDAGRGSTGTDPVWTGAADEFQLRLKGRARGLCARFVRSGPAARAARRRGPLARLSARRRQLGAPPIIPRAEWGGDGVPPRSGPAYGQVQLAFVHHTVNANDYGPEDSAAIVLGIARYHRDHNGWNDIGYNFLVDQYGQIFEGRAGGVELAIVGAQAQGFNSVSTGVACIGTFISVAPPAAAIDAIARVVGWKLSLHGMPVQGAVTVTSAGGESNLYPSGAPVTFQRVSGHRDGNATSCPGDVLYGQLPALRIRAAQYAGPLAGVTLRAASTKLRGVTSAVVSGALRFADGGSPAGAPVDILYATAGAAFSPIATVRCAADGQWSTTIDVPQTGTLRARYPGDATHGPLESSSLKISVVPQLAIGVSSRRLRRRRRLAVSGVVSPSSESHVVVLVERKVGAGYRRVRRRRTLLRAGRYVRFFRLARAGLYRVTVRVPGASARQYVRVLR